MKRTAFLITIMSAAVYLVSCLTAPPTFEDKASSIGMTIITGNEHEKGPVMKELLSKCRPTGKIEALTVEQEGDYIINRALDLGANAVHIYYAYYAGKESDAKTGLQLYYMTRFWICKEPVNAEKK